MPTMEFEMNNLRYQRSVMISMSTAAFLVAFVASSLNLAIPKIVAEFSLSTFSLSLVMCAYLLSTSIFQMPAARLADLVGRKKVFITGIFVFGAFSFLCTLATSGGLLMVMRFCMGIGSAMMFGTNMAILTAVFPPEKRGMAIGINTAVVYFSLAIGPFAGGSIAHYWDWRGIFYFCAILALAAGASAIVAIKQEWTEAKGEPFDFIGSAMYSLSLSGVIYGFTTLPSVAGCICLALGLAGMAVFVRYERHCRYPILKINLFFNNPGFALSSLAAMINYAATFAVSFLISLYLQYIKGMDAQQAGLLLVVQPVFQCALSVLVARLMHWIKPVWLASLGMAMVTLGIFGLCFLEETTSLAYLAVVLALLGIGFGIFSSPNSTIIMTSVGKQDYSTASATTGTVRMVGQALSIAIGAMTIYSQLGDIPIENAPLAGLLSGVNIAFSVFVCLCLVGIYASFARFKRIEPKPGR